MLHDTVSVTMQLSSTITSKGQVLIPAAIRIKLKLKPFDRIIFNVSGTKLMAEKAPTTEQMYGFIKTKRKLTDKQLEDAIEKAVVEGVSEDNI